MVLGGAACYAVLPALVKIAYEHGADARGVLAVRFAIAAPLLLGFLAVRRPALVCAWRRAGIPVSAAVLLPLVLYQFQTLAFFESLARMNAVVAVLIFFSYPLMVAVGGALFLQESLTLRSGALIALGSAGVYLSVGVRGGASAAGVSLALIGALLFAWYFMTAKRVLSAGVFDGPTLTALTCSVSAVAFALLVVVAGGSLPADALGWTVTFAMAVVGTGIAALLLYSGLHHLDAATAATLSAAEPPLAVLLAALLLSEPVAAVQVAGMAIVAVSLVGLSYRATRPVVAIAPSS